MPDYDLSRLSTRSFEQLIQSLAAKILGPGLVVFGDGPDGGREATFEGKVPYPNSEDPWNGYVVVQAKFKQRSEGTTRDGRWALSQLRHELAKFEGRKRNLRKPEYYLFCTNVVLSPKHKTGFKDRITRELGIYQKRLSMKGFDFWDSDKLRIFLDGNSEIRRTYAAWVTSGDVLAAVISRLEQLQPNFRNSISSFLQKELLSDQFVNLDQAGHSTEEQIPMARVFVDLLASPQPLSDSLPERNEVDEDTPGFVQVVVEAGKCRLNYGTDVPQKGTVLRKTSPGEPNLGRFVLIGGPGQGKTTTAQYVCQLFRVALLADHSGGISIECRKAISLIRNQCQAEGLEIPTVKRFPIRIPLSDFAKELASNKIGAPRSVVEYLASRIRLKTSPEFSVADLKEWLANYPWFVVFDGLDEVPASTNRAEVLRAIQEFWVDAASADADILVLATTRPQGYNREFSAEFYTVRYLVPLSVDRALRYGQRLADARFGHDVERGRRVMARLKAASTVDATARLMTSPLQVTIMATLVDRAGQPPPERWRLFSEYYDVIYQREMERDNPASAILRAHKANIDGIHHWAGLELQIESERTGQTDARLSRDRFALIVRSRLETEGYAGPELEHLLRSITDAATQRLVFLVGLEADKVGFEIRSLQEFMAAEALMDGGDEKVGERLRAIAPISYWRNVFLFAAGKCFALRQHLRDIVASVCDNLNEEGDLEHVTLAGSELALDLVHDGTARQHPKYLNRLARIACKLATRPASGVHLLLANAHEDSLDTIFREEVPIGSLAEEDSNRSGALLTAALLAIKDVTWAADFADRNWPGDIFQKISLARHLRRTVSHPWLQAKVEQAIQERSGLLLNVMDLGKIAPKPWAKVFELLSEQTNLVKKFPFRHSGSGSPVFYYRFVECNQPELARALQDLPSECGPWNFLKQGADFMLKPDKAKLADWLMASADAVGYGSIGHMALPWPFRECVNLVNSSNGIREIADRALKGDFGDTDDWLEAESRWSRGISAEDIIEFDRRNEIIGGYLRDSGVVHDFGMSITHSPEILQVFGDLMKFWPRLRNPKSRAQIAADILFIASAWNDTRGHSKGGINLDPPVVLELGRSIAAVESETVQLSALISQSPEDIRGAEWISFLDDIGRRERISFWDEFRDDRTMHFATAVRDAFVSDTRRRGLARILALIIQRHRPGGGTEFHISSSLLKGLSWEETKFRRVVIQLRLAQPDVSQEDAIELGREVAEGGKGSSGFVQECVGIATRTLDRPALEKFMIDLSRVVRRSDWDSRSRIMVALDEILLNRRSTLHDPQVRSHLQLPSLLA